MSVLLSLSVVIIIEAVVLLAVAIRMVIAIIRLIAKCIRKLSKRRSKTISLLSLSPVEIGRQGEDDLYRKLLEIPGEKYILKNLVIPTAYGTTTEIDCVMINASGIHVFEYKNYHCDVYIPDINADRWIRTPHGDMSHGYSFYSPIKQNDGHINALGHVLSSITGTHGINKLIHSHIVFGNNCNLFGSDSDALSASVCQLSIIGDNNSFIQNRCLISPSIYSFLSQYASYSCFQS